MDPLEKWRHALIGWILWQHNPEGQSDDRLNNNTGKNTAINQLSPDLMMAWEWKSHLGTAWALGFVCACVWLHLFVLVIPSQFQLFCGAFLIWLPEDRGRWRGADWWDACSPHGKHKACTLCVFELANEIWFLLLEAGWISVFTTTYMCFV